MTKVFRLTDIDCPVCAGKVQDLISKIDGVKNARVDFLVLKLTIEAEEKDFPSIMKQAEKAVKKIEPDCDIEDWD
ncbi:MAG: cation transporter [Clostridia bacterium]|nr:cation transporter [Clostridia bacterium]MBR6650136.1 cation transporter [Clostridia bacterium]